MRWVAAVSSDGHVDNPGEARGAPATVAPRRRPLNQLLVVAGLSGLALVQPVLELLGENPTALQFRGLEGTRIALFAAALVVVPPLVLWLIGRVVTALHAGAGWWVHLATVGVLGAVVVDLLSKAVADQTAFNVIAAVAGGAGVTGAYVRFDAAFLWLRLLAGANVLFLANFVFLAPVSDWITEDNQRAADTTFSGVAAGEAPPSVVMVVLDELPTQSLLDADGTGIDPVRFPNLARFAGDATWYRHFSTVSPFTQSAVPALLDGQDPHGAPIWTDHPDNLFSLLAGSHHLIVSESLTKLCGFEVCSGDPQPVADGAGAPDPGSDGTGTASTEWAALLGDVRRLWVERVAPGPAGPSQTFDDFTEQLAEPLAAAEAATASANGSVVSVPESQQLDGYFASRPATQPARMSDFLDALQPTDEPYFAFLHLVLPHQPWFFREDGVRYRTPGEYQGPDISMPWRARVTRQRHLLQAEYADRLVGVVLGQLRRSNEYDDTLVVVVSDHGASFAPGESVRSLEDENLDDIAYAPLLIKAPGQDDGRVDDANLLSVDVAPTIADLLGTEPGWPVDGVAADDAEAIARRGDDKYVYSYTDAFTYDFLGIEEFDDAEAHPEMVAGRFPTVGARDERIAALYEGQPGADLIGRPADAVFTPGGDDALVRELDELEQPSTDERLGEVIGVVPAAGADAEVVVAVNGTIVGVSPLFDDARASRQFVVLLPAGTLRADANDVRIGVLGPDGTTAAELELAGTD